MVTDSRSYHTIYYTLTICPYYNPLFFPTKMAPRTRIQAHSADSHEEYIDPDGGPISSDLNSDGDDSDAHVTRFGATTGTVEKVW